MIPASVREAMENTLGDVWCENVHTEKSRVVTLMATQAISTLPSIPKTTLGMLQRSYPVLACVWHHWDTHTRPTSVTMRTEAKPVRKILSFWQQLSEKDGVLYRTIELNRQPVEQLLLPACMHTEVLCALHDDIGHQSPEKTLALARTRCYWSGIVQDITDYCRQCARCIVAKEGRKVHSAMGSLTANKPLDVVAMDFTLLDRASSGLENVLVMTDVFTKYTQAIPTCDQTANTVARVLVKEWFVRFVSREGYTATKGRTSMGKLWKHFVDCMASRRAGQPRITRKATRGVNGSIVPYTTGFAPCLPRRRRNGLNFFPKSSMDTTAHHTPTQDTLHFICSLELIRSYLSTTFWDDT